MKNSKAFSIAEISVVLLIISILIAAISEGTNLYRKSKLASARNLTQNSPVVYYEGLTVWLETTSKDSFDYQTPGNGDPIENWHSINPLTYVNNKFTVTQATLADRPTYNSSAINGLPGLYFNLDYLSKANVKLSEFASSNQSTIFIVQSVSSGGTPFAWQAVMPRVLFHTPAGTNFYYIFESTANDGVINLVTSDISASNKIIVGIKNSTGLIARINGVQIGTDASTQSLSESATNPFIIGAASTAKDTHFTGNIGEIIMFNRQLSDNEINSVESYLSQKWKIALN